jgi:hypothetical protein
MRLMEPARIRSMLPGFNRARQLATLIARFSKNACQTSDLAGVSA